MGTILTHFPPKFPIEYSTAQGRYLQWLTIEPISGYPFARYFPRKTANLGHLPPRSQIGQPPTYFRLFRDKIRPAIPKLQLNPKAAILPLGLLR